MWFWTTDEKQVDHPLDKEIEEQNRYFTRGGDEFVEDDTEGNSSSKDLGERVRSNRDGIIDNRKRIVRIDERTALMLRLLFVMVVTLIVSIGAGLTVSWATSITLLFAKPAVENR